MLAQVPRRLVLAALCTVLLLGQGVALAAPAAPAAPAPEPLPPVTNSDRHFGAAEAFRVQQTTLAQDAGVKWERVTMSWPQLDPGYWNGPWYLPFPYLDSQIAHDIDLVGMLINTPDAHSTNLADGTTAVPAGLYLPVDDPNNSWAQFARRTARFYHGRIFHWIIWNEPDITATDPNAAYRTWSGTVADYYRLLKVGYLAVKEVDPTLTVGTAGFTYWTDARAGRRQYFDRMLDLVAQDPTAPAHNYYMDFVSLHLYSDPHSLYNVPVLYHQLMAARGFDKPIWINETNVIPWDDPVNAGTPRGSPGGMRATLDEQASFIVQAYALGLAAGVQRIEVYKMKDGDNDVVNGQALVRNLPTLQPRPEYVSYQLAATYFSHAKSATWFRQGQVEEVVFDRGDQRVTALWNDSFASVRAQVHSSGGIARALDKYGQPAPLGIAAPGVYALELPAATDHANLQTPNSAMIGGSPLLLIEDGSTVPPKETLLP
ncbi:MAG: hypothetical protein ACRDHX_05640 [Chloroflexota bacterium]